MSDDSGFLAQIKQLLTVAPEERIPPISQSASPGLSPAGVATDVRPQHNDYIYPITEQDGTHSIGTIRAPNRGVAERFAKEQNPGATIGQILQTGERDLAKSLMESMDDIPIMAQKLGADVFQFGEDNLRSIIDTSQDVGDQAAYNAGDGFHGFLEAFNLRADLASVGGGMGHKNQAAVARKLETLVPGTRTEVRQGVDGDAQVWARLPNHKQFVPLDRANAILTGIMNPGDLGDIWGNVATFTNLASTVAAITASRVAAAVGPGPIKIPAWVVGNLATKSPIITKWIAASTQAMLKFGKETIPRQLIIGGYQAAAAGGGSALDLGIEEWGGYGTGRSTEELIRQITYVAGSEAALEVGMRGLSGAVALFSTPLQRVLFMQGNLMSRDLVQAGNRLGMPIFVPELHTLSASGLSQLGQISSRTKRAIIKRDIMIRAGVSKFFRSLGDFTEMPRDQLSAALKGVEKNITREMKDTGARLMSLEEARNGYMAYVLAKKTDIKNWATSAQKHFPEGGFDISGAVEGAERYRGTGIRARMKDVEAPDQPIIRTSPTGVEDVTDVTSVDLRNLEAGKGAKYVSDTDGSKILTGDLHPRVVKTLEEFHQLNHQLKSLNGGLPDPSGAASTAVNQMATLRQKAFAIVDDPNYNDASREAAAALYNGLRERMRNVVSDNPRFNAEMKELSQRIDFLEDFQTKGWVMELQHALNSMDPKQFGNKIFNLQRPDVIKGLKEMTLDSPGGVQKWETIREGWMEQFFNNPQDAVATLQEPLNHPGLRNLFSVSELKWLEESADSLNKWMTGPMYDVLKTQLDDFHPVAYQLMKTGDVAGVAALVRQWGGTDTPQARNMLAAMGQVLVEKHTAPVDGHDVLNKLGLAQDMLLMKDQGWWKALMPDDTWVEADYLRRLLSKLVGAPGLGEGMVAAGIAQQAIQSVTDSVKGSATVAKLANAFIAGRLLTSSSLAKIMGTQTPASLGLIPSDASVLRQYVKMINHVRIKAEDDQKMFKRDFHFATPANHIIDFIARPVRVVRELPNQESNDASMGLGPFGLGSAPVGDELFEDSAGHAAPLRLPSGFLGEGRDADVGR